MEAWELSEVALTRCVRHFLYFDDEAAGREAARRLADDGAEVWCGRSGFDQSTLVLVTDAALLESVVKELTELAEALGGHYDGWESEMEPEPESDSLLRELDG